MALNGKSNGKVNGEEFMRVKDGYLEIRQKLGPAGKLSSSGKSKVHFSTNGNVDVDGYKLGVNLYKSAR